MKRESLNNITKEYIWKFIRSVNICLMNGNSIFRAFKR